MITIASCDDNLQFSQLLNEKIREYCAYNYAESFGCTVIAPFSSADEVLLYMERATINLLFLDIDMPRTNGFALAKQINVTHPDTLIVFVSSYESLVFSSFEYNPFRFIRKSQLDTELPSVLKNAIDKCSVSNEVLSFSSTEGEVLLRTKEILYLESDKNYYNILCVSGEKHRCRGSLSSVDSYITSFDFFRIHPAYIINMEYVEQYNGTAKLVMKNGKEITISRRKAADFRKAFARYTRMKFVL